MYLGHETLFSQHCLCWVWTTFRQYHQSNLIPGERGEGKERMRTLGIMPDYSLTAVAVCFFFPSYRRPKRHVAFFRLA